MEDSYLKVLREFIDPNNKKKMLAKRPLILEHKYPIIWMKGGGILHPLDLYTEGLYTRLAWKKDTGHNQKIQSLDPALVSHMIFSDNSWDVYDPITWNLTWLWRQNKCYFIFYVIVLKASLRT